MFSFARNTNITVSTFQSQQQLHQLFHLPLSEIAFQQLQALHDIINELITIDNNDIWKAQWGNFAAAKAYRFIMGHRQIPLPFKWLWKTFCQPKHKIFFWLLLSDRLSTKNILKRKNMHLDSYDCAMCQDSLEETMEHLFLGCPFAAACWYQIGIVIQSQDNIFNTIQQLKDQTHPQFFMIVAILMCWCIWTARNDLIFNGRSQSPEVVKANFQKELKILTLRAKARFVTTFDLWIQNLL